MKIKSKASPKLATVNNLMFSDKIFEWCFMIHIP